MPSSRSLWRSALVVLGVVAVGVVAVSVVVMASLVRQAPGIVAAGVTSGAAGTAPCVRVTDQVPEVEAWLDIDAVRSGVAGLRNQSSCYEGQGFAQVVVGGAGPDVSGAELAGQLRSRLQVEGFVVAGDSTGDVCMEVRRSTLVLSVRVAHGDDWFTGQLREGPCATFDDRAE